MTRNPDYDHAKIRRHVRIFVRLMQELAALREGGEEESTLLEGAQRGLEEALCERLISLLDVRIDQAVVGGGHHDQDQTDLLRNT